MRKIGGFLAFILIFSALATSSAAPSVPAGGISLSGIKGYVVDGSATLTASRSSIVIPNDLPPIRNATIRVRTSEVVDSVPNVEWVTASDSLGRFALPDVVVPEPYLKVTVEVSRLTARPRLC